MTHLERAALERAAAITGPCSCHEAYTTRKMRDPQCAYHGWAGEIADALRTAEKEAWTVARVMVCDIADSHNRRAAAERTLAAIDKIIAELEKEAEDGT